jgi:hypothetical protein
MRKLLCLGLFAGTTVLAQQVTIENNSNDNIPFVYIKRDGKSITTKVTVDGVEQFDARATNGYIKLDVLYKGRTAVFTFDDLSNESAELWGYGNHILRKFDVGKDKDNPLNFARVNDATSKATVFNIHEVYADFPVAGCVDSSAGPYDGCSGLPPPVEDQGVEVGT